MKIRLKIFSAIIIISLTYLSCTTEREAVISPVEKGEKYEIHYTEEDQDPELFYFSDIIKKDYPVKYISFSSSSSTDNSEINRNDIIGMSRISENRLAAADRNGNVVFYKLEGKKWKAENSISLETEETSSFTAFSADNSYLALYSGKTSSIYMFSQSGKTPVILKLYSGSSSFSRNITDIDMGSEYIYLIDTENRISIIDYRKKTFETEFRLDSRIPLRSFSLINENGSISLAALSPGTGRIYIYPLSGQYMMINEKGYIKKAGISSFNYGTHVLVSDSGEILYALESSIQDLSDFTGGEVTVTGKLDPEYPVDGGPEFLRVSEVRK